MVGLNFKCKSLSVVHALQARGEDFSAFILIIQADGEESKDAFSKYGKVADAVVILDRDTGISRGFGFVTFARDKDAKSAMVAMRGQALDGREIYISVSDRPPSVLSVLLLVAMLTWMV